MLKVEQFYLFLDSKWRNDEIWRRRLLSQNLTHMWFDFLDVNHLKNALFYILWRIHGFLWLILMDFFFTVLDLNYFTRPTRFGYYVIDSLLRSVVFSLIIGITLWYKNIDSFWYSLNRLNRVKWRKWCKYIFYTRFVVIIQKSLTRF